MSCFRPDFRLFRRSRSILGKVPVEKLPPALPTERRPSAGNQTDWRSLVLVLLKTSVVPTEEGSLSMDFDNSKSPGVPEPPPMKTTPAGRSSERFIFLK